MSTSSRLLSLLALLQTPRTWSGRALAERLGVSRRTVRRDVDRLRELGYPVEGSLGPDGGYRLVAGSAVPPLLLDDDEAVAIAVSIRTAAGNTVAGIDEAAIRALAKLEQVMPARLRARFGGLGAATAAVPGYGAPVDPAVLTALAGAITGHHRLRFAYRAPDSAETRRSVEPVGLVVMGRAWYLVAWDEDRADWRSFRVDRVRDPWTTGRPFTPRSLPENLDAAEWLQRRRLEHAPTYRLVATLDAPFEVLAPRAGDAAAGLEALDGGHSRLTLEGETLPWLAFRLIGLDTDFEVHEPPELRAWLADLVPRLRRSARARGTDDDSGRPREP